MTIFFKKQRNNMNLLIILVLAAAITKSDKAKSHLISENIATKSYDNTVLKYPDSIYANRSYVRNETTDVADKALLPVVIENRFISTPTKCPNGYKRGLFKCEKLFIL